jgi:hypothetical protein
MSLARHFTIPIVVTLSLILMATGAATQTFTGSIAGTVKDPGDLVLPGVTVTTTNVNTGQVRTVVSGSGGEFIFPGLQPGEYHVDAELSGFTKKSISGITVQVNQRVEVPVRLEVGQVSETINVIGGATLVETTSATVGQVIEQRRVVDLPLNGRDFVQLATLSAGVENRQTTRGLLSTNGTRGNGVGFLFDGVDGNDANAIFLSLTPSIEAIQEFKIQTSTYSAEFGRNAGAQINLVTKAGTNDFHGSAFYFLRDESLDAKNYFDPPTDEIPPFSRDQFGFVFSGPVRRNKTFFLGNYEGTRQNKALTALATVPTLAERNGDFSRTVDPVSGAQIVVRDPNTGLPFPNNIIPSARIDATGRQVAALYPEPNRLSAQNFVSSPEQTFVADLLTLRVDHTVSVKDMFFARYFLSDSLEYNPFGRVAGGGGTNVPGFGVEIPSRGQNLALNWTRVITPRLLLEARFGYHRYDTGRYQDNTVNGAAELGIEGVSDAEIDQGYPLFTITGYTTVGDRNDLPQGRPQNTYHYFANLTYNTGGHDVRTGFEVRQLGEDLFANTGVRGGFTFNPTFTGYGLGDVLLGLPTIATLTTPGLLANWRDTSLGLFVQDDWKVSEKLTVNLGLRYDYFTPLVDKFDRRAIFDFADNGIKQVGQNGIPRAGYLPDRNNFAPRIGFAFLPRGGTRFVTRGGYGLFYDKENWNTHQGLNNQPLFRTSRQYQRPGSIAKAFTASSTVPLPNVNAMQMDFRDAYYHQWNVFVEGEPITNFTVGVGYVGSKGLDLPLTRDINQPTPGTGAVQARRPIAQYATVAMVSSGTNSIYHSLQARAERRFSKGLSFLTSYTLSKSVDTVPIYGGSAPDATNIDAARGPADTDSRHRFSASFNYELPFGQGQAFLSDATGLSAALLGGWQVNGIVVLAAGVPFTPFVSQDIAGTGRPGSQWPDRTCSGELDDPRPERWFDASCFRPAAPGTFGNGGRNTLVGPGRANVDLSVFKQFTIRADDRLQFRLEIFNLFNHANFAQPNATVDAPLTVGRISATATDSRQVQLALKYLF